LSGSEILSHCFESEPFGKELDGLSQSRGTETEGAFDDASLAADVAREIEGCCLCFVERAHHCETLDCRVSRLQCFEASDRPDQLLQLAVVCLDNVVQILDLAMLRRLGTSALPLELGESGGVGRRVVGVDDARLLPVLQTVQRLAEEALRRRGAARW